jgi:hypothetical protein
MRISRTVALKADIRAPPFAIPLLGDSENIAPVGMFADTQSCNTRIQKQVLRCNSCVHLLSTALAGQHARRDGIQPHRGRPYHDAPQ